MEQRKTLYFEAGIEEGIGAQDFGVYDDLLNALHNAKGLMNETDRLCFAFEAIESSKANLLKYGLLEENYLSTHLPTAENNRRIDLKTKVYEALKNVNQSGDNTLQDTLMEAKKRYLQYLQPLRKKYAVAYSPQQQVIAATDPLLARHNGTIINYYLGQDFLYAFIHQNGTRQFTRKKLTPVLLQCTLLPYTKTYQQCSANGCRTRFFCHCQSPVVYLAVKRHQPAGRAGGYSAQAAILNKL